MPETGHEPQGPQCTTADQDAAAARLTLWPPNAHTALLNFAARETPTTAVQIAQQKVDVATQKKMDAFMQKFTPTYHTIDGDVTSPVPFQMSKTWADQRALMESPLNRYDLKRAKEIAHLSDGELTQVLAGRGDPEQIHRIIQALIDVRGAPDSGKPWSSDEIRNLAYNCGIGIDCANFTQRDYLYTKGITRAQAGFGPVLNESLEGLGKRGYQRVELKDVRPGDLLILNSVKSSEVGHRAIVYGSRPASAQELEMLSSDPKAHSFGQGGKVVALDVDSSWGSHNDPTSGGVERKTLWYDEASKDWAYEADPHNGVPKTLTVNNDRPYGHVLVGFYRGPRQ